MQLKKVLKKAVYGAKSDSESYVEHLKAIGMKIGHTFKSVIFWAISIGLVGMLSGIFISYYWETPASATITLIFIAFFGLVSIFGPLLKAE